ncbi:hypothetical protein HGM15179_001878 [Zosterops borbonicus]|uniref:Uncharacterized protein n=1 Tax=Zosterops borbonicus TaxID=364589 RepID=A0A8K1GW88_9PASS|nr:hypothetical protein HGM15179_001878 [Zosterops borbonicus]
MGTETGELDSGNLPVATCSHLWPPTGNEAGELDSWAGCGHVGPPAATNRHQAWRAGQWEPGCGHLQPPNSGHPTVTK